MSRLFVATAVAAFVPILATAQQAPKLEYEAASIRPAPQADASVKIGLHTDGSQLRFDYLTLKNCIRIAWQTKDFQVIGPEWISNTRYLIAAKLPEGTFTEDQRREMLKNLLIDRFGLKFHNDKKEFNVYALEVGKNGLKLKETPPDASDAAPAKGVNVSASGSEAGVYVDMGGGSYYSFANNKLIGHKLTFARIADTLTFYSDKPVVDMTGLPADKAYDFSFDISSDDYRVMLIRSAIYAGVTLPPQALQLADQPTDSLFSALDAAGLKFEAKRAPLDVMVVDSANQTPAEN
ncbi:MAG TPA: TIGR03435 family protein [Bryobacteraceae bacterium]|nr:TIGR03435 family protein [Bryobacteraceae bacterium]